MIFEGARQRGVSEFVIRSVCPCRKGDHGIWWNWLPTPKLPVSAAFDHRGRATEGTSLSRVIRQTEHKNTKCKKLVYFRRESSLLWSTLSSISFYDKFWTWLKVWVKKFLRTISFEINLLIGSSFIYISIFKSCASTNDSRIPNIYGKFIRLRQRRFFRIHIAHFWVFAPACIAPLIRPCLLNLSRQGPPSIPPI